MWGCVEGAKGSVDRTHWPLNQSLGVRLITGARVRRLEVNGRGLDGNGYGISFHGANGTLFINREGFEIFPEGRRIEGNVVTRTEPMREKSSNNQHGSHVQNFIEQDRPMFARRRAA